MAYLPSQNAYQHTCDSYFVEQDDLGCFAARAQTKERAKLLAEERQRAIGEELSYLAKEDLQDDILSHMEHMEVSVMLRVPPKFLLNVIG